MTDSRGVIEEPLSTRRHDYGLLIVLVTILVLVGSALFLEARSEQQTSGERVEIDLKAPLQKLDLRRTDHGLIVVDRLGREFSGERWLEAVAMEQEFQRGAGPLYVIFNITKPVGFLWVSIGFIGQAAFTFRMLLQWFASERAGRSVVPLAFWYGSLAGGLLLLVYFIWRRDIVGVTGQSTGIFVYSRNIMLARRAFALA